MRSVIRFAAVVGFGLIASVAEAAQRPHYRAVVIDGQGDHDWQATTPSLKHHLEDSQIFTVDVATTPPKGHDMRGFQPNFGAYRLVVLNYNGQPWPEATKAAFVNFVEGGGGVVVVHAAGSAFPEWPQYQQIVGLREWGGRSEDGGQLIRYDDSGTVVDERPTTPRIHGPWGTFEIVARDHDHPINVGLPRQWLHGRDELYLRMRGSPMNVHVLSTAFATRGPNGNVPQSNDEHQPCLFTVNFGRGHVFHTTLGHDAEAMRCVGFIVTLQRGAEWAASGKVTTQPPPADFPTANRVSLR
ncbi:MAG TPA: ThuA domain-containing protein [Pirellulales bacterium]|jgi:type 1 glutamine amidotransferase|nr:ThuA domain-containing protein [Pirellulales bacterium]